MPAYLTLATFKARTVMPAADVDRVEAAATGWIDQKLASRSAAIDARLAKRYDVPFSTPIPEAVLDWLARIVTPDVYFKRGVNPSDEQFAAYKGEADAAWAEIDRAADSVTGLFDLPLRQDTTMTGIARGTPLSYSEASPYTFTDRQREAVEREQ